MCKRAAVEREPSTLEKDKEDQSKYYLSFSKPPVLDMQWENRDIIVAERAKFSKIDNIVPPLRFLELFFDYVLVDMIIVIERKQTLFLKQLMKKFAYS